MEKEAVLKEASEEVSKEQWSEYFASIVSVCPWSKSYWKQQKIDIQTWKGTQYIPPLKDNVARMWIHTKASDRTLDNIQQRLNDRRTHEEWLYSHPCNGRHSTPVPILIQQNLQVLTKARKQNANLANKRKTSNNNN